LSEFNGILDIIENTNENITTQKSVNTATPEQSQQMVMEESDDLPSGALFDIKDFSRELYHKSQAKNKAYMEVASNISGHDVAHGCILSIVNKILNVPVENYADKWLPIFMRNTIGSAVHDFIQCNTDQFTETEVSMKVPSVRFSGRIDCLIGTDVLVEIKTCTYKDYESIIRSQKPRTPDFYQTMVYKYILENYIDEIRNPEIVTRSPKPKYKKYDIKKIQFLYIAHDIIAADVENIGEALAAVTTIKKALSSKSDPFYFIKSLTLDLSTFDPKPYMDFIDQKLKCINWYIDNNKIPSPQDPFINKKACFFCLYSSNCPVK
jgi:hypothetical protein